MRSRGPLPCPSVYDRLLEPDPSDGGTCSPLYGPGMASDFFGPRPQPVEEPRPTPPSPPWMGPPHGVMPGVAPVELAIASNSTAAVYVGRCSAYPTGFELEVRVLIAAGADLDPSLNGPHHHPGRGSNYEEMLKFGLEFSSGSCVNGLRRVFRSAAPRRMPSSYSMPRGVPSHSSPTNLRRASRSTGPHRERSSTRSIRPLTRPSSSRTFGHRCASCSSVRLDSRPEPRLASPCRAQAGSLLFDGDMRGNARERDVAARGDDAL